MEIPILKPKNISLNEVCGVIETLNMTAGNVTYHFKRYKGNIVICVDV